MAVRPIESDFTLVRHSTVALKFAKFSQVYKGRVQLAFSGRSLEFGTGPIDEFVFRPSGDDGMDALVGVRF